MSETVKIVAETRDKTGSAESGRLRKSGWLPCSVSIPGGKAKSIKVNRHDLEQMLAHHGRENLIADLQIDSEEPKKVFLSEIQHDPVRGGFVHMDFIEISMTKKMRVEVSIELAGDPAGVVEQGGILDQALRFLEIECLPGDMPEAIHVDVGHLRIGDGIHVRDIQLDPKLAVLTQPGLMVASVVAPREEEVVAPVEGVAAVGEPEVIGEKKETAEGEEDEAEADASDGKKGKSS